MLRLQMLGAAVTAGSLAYLIYRKYYWFEKNVAKKLLVITGCDSGLGYSMALHFCEEGLHVFAGVLDPDNKNLDYLKSVAASSGRLYLEPMDITDPESVKKAVEKIEDLSSSKNLEVFTLINNAGVMVFGEFEWLTEDLIMRHIEVNLLGTFRVTKALLPALRKSKGRIINITSHCSLVALPTLSVYSATKFGLKAWSESLRMEMSKFGINVIQFLPGSFVTKSRILASQKPAVDLMARAMSTENESLYKEYFDRLMSYLLQIPFTDSQEKIHDSNLYRLMEHAIFSPCPAVVYTNAPLRYKIYHFLFNVTPRRGREYLIWRFLSLPGWKK